ncbi:MAG: hypothetical protein ACTSO7_17605 [Candidatus Heimdallarchaeota archaeon]
MSEDKIKIAVDEIPDYLRDEVLSTLMKVLEKENEKLHMSKPYNIVDDLISAIKEIIYEVPEPDS